MRIVLFALASCGGSSEPVTPDSSASDAPPAGECDDTAPWATAAPLDLGPTQETAVVALAGKVYILGGFNNLTITTAVQVFDTATCRYAAGPALPMAVHHVNAAVVDGTIVVGGALATTSFTAIGDTWTWNPATETSWTARASMPAGTQRGAAVAGSLDGKLIVAGGFRNGNAVSDVSVYDVALDQWTALDPLPAPRDHACGGVIGNKLYVAGGRMAAIPSTSPLTFELTGTTWDTKAPMITGRGGTACGVLGDRLIVVGGEGNPAAASGVFSQVEAYTATTNTWEALAPMPTPRHGMGAAASGDRVYVPGGATTQGFGAVATHEVLTP